MKPLFIYNRWLPFGRFRCITLLFVVLVKRNATLTATLRRHETIHAWQQVCLFMLGLIAAVALYVCTNAWWVWLLPVVLPFALYALCWLVEVCLPPYNEAYKNICFEREAYANERNENFKFIPFSFLRYIKIGGR